MYRYAAGFLVSATFAVTPLSVLANPLVIVPTGLNPGDQYRLAFVTTTPSLSYSSDIDDYNDLVTTVANSVSELVALGTTWKVIGSTDAVDARDNTGTNPFSSPGVPIYNTAGELVALSNSDLWDGSIVHAIDFYESAGTSGNTVVWTGTRADGTASEGFDVLRPSGALGSTSLNPIIAPTVFTMTGSAGSINSSWIHSALNSHDQPLDLYGMSGILTVVPEPSALVLACLAGAGLAVSSLRRRRQCKR